MGDIRDDIEAKAEELRDNDADDQHLGDAMDDAEPERADEVIEGGELEDGRQRQPDDD